MVLTVRMTCLSLTVVEVTSFLADLELSLEEPSRGPKGTLASRGPSTAGPRLTGRPRERLQAGLGWVWPKGLESRIQLRFWNQ